MKETNNEMSRMDSKRLTTIINEACARVAPYWPLESFVAVNPYLGFTNEPFEKVSKKLLGLANIQTTQPLHYYLEKVQSGYISNRDIQASIEKFQLGKSPSEFIEELTGSDSGEDSYWKYPTCTDTASELTGKDWSSFMTSRISGWASSYFDKSQSAWKNPISDLPIFLAWKYEASVDRSYEISGLKGFRKALKKFPDNSEEALRLALDMLEVKEDELSDYFTSLLYQVSGWSAYIAKFDWDEKLASKEGRFLHEFLAVLVSIEACVQESLESRGIAEKWKASRETFKDASDRLPKELTYRLVMQDAFEKAYQQKLIKQFKSVPKSKTIESKKELKAQAIFCIDVRSEVYRRNLEAADPQIETLGFAGFFGMPIEYTPLAQSSGEEQCPVLLKPGFKVNEASDQEYVQSKKRRTWRQQVKYLKHSFKAGAINCFGFVSPLGLSFLPKLLGHTFRWNTPAVNPQNAGMDADWEKIRKATPDLSQIGVDERITLAKNALVGMSLTEGFAPLVLLIGHGATTTNNPHTTGLDCGACGGHAGEINARVAAGILNQKEVRDALRNDGIEIPSTTLFIAGQHNTTTDEVTLRFDQQLVEGRKEELDSIQESLNKAGFLTRVERASRMNLSDQKTIQSDVINRSKDWSQIRPEWGLAGCSAFVIANRGRTKNLDCKGQSFLHNYDWKKDREFKVLEQIMTAPMIVTSWINLQYYGSAVDNLKFGSGNKTLHNITAGLGVLEGHSGDLRVGLPMQSIHDGKKYQHESLKLNVIIEAPSEAIDMVMEKHDSVRDLVENGWLHLFTIGDAGQISKKYERNEGWAAAENILELEEEMVAP